MRALWVAAGVLVVVAIASCEQTPAGVVTGVGGAGGAGGVGGAGGGVSAAAAIQYNGSVTFVRVK